VGGVDQRGGAPGTRETDALYPLHLVQQVHAIVLAGGSAFGLDAASGVVRYLEERGVGFDVRVARVPIVPAAILFDLSVGKPDVRPDAAMGYQACLNAASGPLEAGNVGAGTGATVGKVLGITQAMKAGLGNASIHLGNGLVVGAIAAVNAFGDVIQPNNGTILAGARQPHPGEDNPVERKFVDTLQVFQRMAADLNLNFSNRTNTVIGVVATNAALNKEQANKMAQMAQDGLARTIRPAHTMVDGDTIFALSMGEMKADVSMIGAFAAEAFSQAILNAIYAATPIQGIPAISSFRE